MNIIDQYNLEFIDIDTKISVYKQLINDGYKIYAYRWVSWNNGISFDTVLSMENSSYLYEPLEQNCFMTPRLLTDGETLDHREAKLVESEACHFSDIPTGKLDFDFVGDYDHISPFTIVKLRGYNLI